MSAVDWLVAAAPLAACGLTVVNAATWRRGTPGRSYDGTVSVLIPARNEAQRLPAALRSIAASRHPLHEIVVYDDGSTDETPAVLQALAREIPRLRVLRGEGTLPVGWVGKPHACDRLARSATGDVLVFVDADVCLAADGLERLASVGHTADVVTAVPRQVTVSLLERLVVPFLLLSYVSWLPLELVARTRDPRVVAANGQVLAMRRRALEDLGGFGVVRGEIVDDVALCRAAKEAGLRVAFVDGTHIASCRMYGSGRAVWDGFSKNIHEGVGGSVALGFVVALYVAAFVAPWMALGAAAFGAFALGPAAAAAGANVLQRTLLAWRWRQSAWGVVHHAAGALVVIAIAINSLCWSLRGDIRWAGRSYGARAVRRRLA